MDYEATDKAALNGFLLRERMCPRCRRDLQPVAFAAHVWGCAKCKETWDLSEK